MIEWLDTYDEDEPALAADGDETAAAEPPRPRVGAATAAFFGAESPLRAAEAVGGRPYDPRPQQAAMAERVAAALEAGEHLCVEAPTGVGKTFAYLVPAIHFAVRSGKPVVVSTHTIALQEQILRKDIPILQKLLGLEFKAVLAKGRSNYLCWRRLTAAVGEVHLYLPSDDLIPDLERLRQWAEETPDGSRSDLPAEPPPGVWEAVCCEAGNCLGQNCPFHRSCFFFRARLQLLAANVIVANHALFFSDMAMRRAATAEEADAAAGILPAYAAVVLDEGHTIEETAATHLGLRASSWGLRKALFRLWNPERQRGLLGAAASQPAREAVCRAEEQFERLSRRLLAWLDEAPNVNPRRYLQAGQLPDLMAEPLETAIEKVNALAKGCADAARATELRAAALQLQESREALHAFFNMTLAGHVYWLERHGQRGTLLSLNAAPVEVAPLLRELLFGNRFTVVVTSATLAVRQSMDYFLRRVGARDRAATLVLDSPFDYRRQVTLHLPLEMPNPNTPEFLPAACAGIRRFLLETQGHAFVLFTSYRMMQEAAERLADFFRESGLNLLIQGEGLPRGKLLEAFRATPHAVLFGTDSFWTGVDVPGDALTNVIIVKLPFAVPDHPLMQARQELIESRGGRAFWDYSLPEAILKFRQGFGRLIRSRTDRGIVVVLDNRVTTTGYGRMFLDSLPQCRRQVF
ncbi:MAG: helicase C-terminal domain-containing protein [Lentisphaeria bacterium]|jgi:ATP-dependent DNA helicase DinG